MSRYNIPSTSDQADLGRRIFNHVGAHEHLPSFVLWNLLPGGKRATYYPGNHWRNLAHLVGPQYGLAFVDDAQKWRTITVPDGCGKLWNPGGHNYTPGVKDDHPGPDYMLPLRQFETIEQALAIIPDGLENNIRFSLWSLILREGWDKAVKLPVSPTGYPTSVKDNHMDARTAAHYVVHGGGFVGLGYCFKAEDPIWFADLDGCFDPATGQRSEMALDILARFPGAATERSMSGTGLHIFGAGSHAAPEGHLKRTQSGLEFYTADRFCALTGTEKQGRADIDFSAAIPAFVADYGLQQTEAYRVGLPLPGEADAAYKGAWDDDGLIAAMKASRGNPFGKAHPRDLFDGNWDVIRQHYPQADRHDRYGFDWSAADAALLAHLAFWTGRNQERMERIFGRSALAIRAKWKNRPYYRNLSIGNAVKKCTSVYDRRARIRENVEIGNDTGEDIKPTIMTTDDARRDLIYVGKTKEVYHRPTGRVRTWDAALADYAASQYEVPAKKEGAEPKKYAVLPAWLKDPERITVDALTWSPLHGEICPPPDAKEGNSRAVNTWRGLRPLTVPEDWQERAKTFVTHLEYLIPDVAERHRFIQWLAHMILNPGELPHTCYLMIAEAQGIGRNWLASVLVRVLRGFVAPAVSVPNLLDGSFNEELSKKLLAVVDEIREGMGDRRHERGEAFKQNITAETRRIKEKYGREWQEYNCCRWLLFSNHLDAIPFDNNDRRVIVILNPKDPMPKEYYAALYKLVDEPGFAGSVRRYIETYDISTFSAGDRAPMNAAKMASIQAMTSELDMAVVAFRDMWPGRIAYRSHLRGYLARCGINDPKDNVLNYAIKRAGLINSGHRVRASSGLQSIIIVRDATTEQVKGAPPQVLITDAENAAKNN